MANTIMTAKNTFAEGLIMDFAPDNTQATCMTSALNATLLTFNGNEMSLQNDMGNGRVETAYLPEGYVPVGSCEFGDIIYIVSYNPLTNKSLIGCFPSPERNISSEELYEEDGGYLNLSCKDFLELINNEPTGKLKNTSVKKVLIDNKKLNSGDKYIIYTDENSITLNIECLSDYGILEDGKVNDTHNTLPKYVKLHVVSVEDSGKITYLDTTTKWYDIKDLKYYISSQKIGPTDADLDSYRDLVLSNWSIFNTKVSGKLAILAELEMIDTFSCSYDLELIEDTSEDTELIKYKSYNLYLYPEAFSTKGIELPYICITKASFNNSLEGLKNKKEQSYSNLLSNWVYYYGINDNLAELRTIFKNASNISANDLYGWKYLFTDDGNKISDRDEDGRILIGSVKIPYQHRDDPKKDWVTIQSNSFVYTLEVTPAMEYGRLEHLAVLIIIDFNKIGTGEVSLTTWKYHNSGTTSILTYGIEAYPKPNWEITDIVILFYDNLGLVGEYLLNDKKYYSGTFTEYLGLDGEAINSRFSRYNSLTDKEEEKIIKHKGEEVPSIPDDSKDNYIEDGGKIYINDAATLYSGFLYAAVITVKLKHIKSTTKESSPALYRWFWTNPMFNEYYYSVKDFKELNFELILNGEAVFETTPYYLWQLRELSNLNENYEIGQNYKTYSANAQYIGYGKDNNINMYIYAGLQNNYGCFNLHGFDSKGNIGDIQNIDVDIYLSDSEIKYSIPKNQYEFSSKEAHVGETLYLLLNPLTNNNGCTEVADNFNYYLENPSNLTKEQVKSLENNIKDLFNIYFYNSNGVECNEDTPKFHTTLDKCYYVSDTEKEPIPLSMQALLFNKAYVQGEQGETLQVPVYTPIIDTADDLSPLGIVFKYDSGVKLAFESAVALCHRKDAFSATRLISDGDFNFYAADIDDSKQAIDGKKRLIDISSNTEFLNEVWGNIEPNVQMFFPVYLGGHGKKEGTNLYNAIGATAGSYISTNNWRYKNIIGLDDASKNNSKLTNSSFDINSSANFEELSVLDSISFLGVKYKDGLTVLNTAFLDGVSDKVFYQRDTLSIGSGYDNFAYLLYLLLSNTYHKNKRIKDQQIKVKNYVRNGDYTIDLIKHIVIHLKHNDKNPRNIIMRGFDFLEYVANVQVPNCPDGFKSSSNVTLKFLDYAKDHELKIEVKSLPMSFFNVDIEAYIRRNGLLEPVFDLAPNSWYIYLNNALKGYSNDTVKFSIEDISNNLKYAFKDYILGEENPKLKGVHPKSSVVYSDEEIAYNTYLDYIRNYIGVDLPRYFYTLEEALSYKESYIDMMFGTFPETVSGYTKNYMRQELAMVLDMLFSVYSITGDLDNYQAVFVTNSRLFEEPGGIEYKRGTTVTESHCEFTTYKFFNIFDYLNGFTTSPTKLLGNIFGVKELDKDSAYTGFAKDILINTNYKVV